MITSMHIENFKCFKEFDIELGPFNVLIGPNDTGKTAFLQAVQLLGRAVSAPEGVPSILQRGVRPGGPAGIHEFEAFLDLNTVLKIVGVSDWKQLIWRNNPDNKLAIRAVQARSDAPSVAVAISNPGTGHLSVTIEISTSEEGADSSVLKRLASGSLSNVGCCRFRPEALREGSPLSSEFSPEGKCFPALLDTINRTDREVFLELEKEFYRRFPYYSRIEIPVVTKNGIFGGQGLGLRFRTQRGELLDPESVSDGVMLALAFLAVSYQLDPPKTLLIEEPENGVHHASLKDTVETLKHLSQEKGVQVILTTHSPYLLDHVEAEQVHVFRKDDEGAVHAKKLSDFEGAGEISEMFSTGEKWSLLAEKYGI